MDKTTVIIAAILAAFLIGLYFVLQASKKETTLQTNYKPDAVGLQFNAGDLINSLVSIFKKPSGGTSGGSEVSIGG
jgi:hypothetical protein